MKLVKVKIANNTYSAEPKAKRVLDEYIKTLKMHVGDADMVNDIEVRITELLSEQGGREDAPITLAHVEAIKEQLGEPSDFLAADARELSREPGILKRTTLALLGLLCGAAAIAAIIGTVNIAAGGFVQDESGSAFFLVAYILAISTGLLLTILLFLGAYIAFKMHTSKVLRISVGVIGLVGLLTCGTAIGFAQYASLRYEKSTQANVQETELAMPALSTTAVTALVKAPGLHVQYIVSSEAPRATMKTLKTNSNSNNNVKILLDGTKLIVEGARSSPAPCNVFLCDGPYVTIYGPSLQKVTSESKSNVDYKTESQATLALEAGSDSDVVLSKGTIEALIIRAEDTAEVTTTGASVKSVSLTTGKKNQIELGSVEVMVVRALESCGANEAAKIELNSYASATFSLNNKVVAGKSIKSNCVEVSIESDDL